ncbi:hypothetical protein MtrunA17_Chr5g0427551 [Medicago truncatula]|uniref:Transmembrane protein n=1 Tax=Medicago truncatula TaxID=3880 RepID=A0A396HUP1_MEDTR|nr:hypothetical protein MtrunA17_Chr5g0427551 [Medicago truncatula]
MTSFDPCNRPHLVGYGLVDVVVIIILFFLSLLMIVMKRALVVSPLKDGIVAD